jgi:predicted TIM-barrel fold metal-dependent hydrolase
VSSEGRAIDTHSHWVSASYAEHLTRYAEVDAEFASLSALMLRWVADPDSRFRKIERRVKDMDDCGFDVSVVSLPPPGVIFGPQSLRREIASQSNDELLEACTEHSGRLLASIALPLPYTEDALEELERVAAHPLTRAVTILANTEEFTLDDPRIEPIWKRVAELGLPVQTHPALDCTQPAFEPWLLRSTLGPVMASSLSIARMVLSGLFDRIGDLNVIVPHLGGTLPYLAQRFDDFGLGEAEHPLSHYLKSRLYVDTCSFHPPALRCAVETMGTDRIVMGSDYPWRGRLSRLVDDVTETIPDEADQDLIIYKTASRWFARELEAQSGASWASAS